ncbi:hypothetical protein FD30_GL000751 [Levilactobacillus namurensis DSM 19117]|uniref:Membrane transporter n=2 Tax=Levilactobacillus namurensis TaxID=380393 RepID=A0A0R1K1H2_9LACO|nr:hypothetical protein FD30_GL000751 [Levilactobacillus namurensis DSM 19117]GEO74339.1 hypothetical protein LNA02_10370 [Levilactobacillus namurensis]
MVRCGRILGDDIKTRHGERLGIKVVEPTRWGVVEFMGYLYLAVSIVTELLGTTMLRYSNGFTRLGPTLTSLVAYTICFYFLSLTLRTVNMSVAYALWGGVGIVLTTLVAVLFMHAPINLASVLGIGMILVGSLILNLYGTGH